jgi:hypothetical protein
MAAPRRSGRACWRFFPTGRSAWRRRRSTRGRSPISASSTFRCRRQNIRRCAGFPFICAADGRVVARIDIDVALHPAPEPRAARLLWSPETEMRERLRAHGYRLATGFADAEIVVATRNTPELAAHVRGGGRALLLPEAEGGLTPFFPHWQNVKVVARDGALWRGDWASSFAWLRRRGVFRALPGGPLIDQSFDRVIPTHVISGCNLLDFHARVHAAQAVGWIHKPVGLAVERNYGEGHIVISTFRLLRDPPNADPTAAALLEALLATAANRLAEPERPALASA